MSEAVSCPSLRSFNELFEPPFLSHLERHILPKYLQRQRWFASKALSIKRLRIVDTFIPPDSHFALLILEAELSRKRTERYFLPLSLKRLSQSNKITHNFPKSVVAELSLGNKPATLIDGIYDEAFRTFLFDAIATARSFKTAVGKFVFEKGSSNSFKRVSSSKVLSLEQSNSSVRYGKALFMKVYRKLEEGLNPDAEVLSFLTETAHFEHAPKYVGSVRYLSLNRQETFLALLQTFTQNKSSAWDLTLSEVQSFYKKVDHHEPLTLSCTSFFQNLDAPPLPLVKNNAKRFLAHASLLGKRTAELHLALASSKPHAFKPERLTEENQTAIQNALIAEATTALKLLHTKFQTLSENAKELAEWVLSRRQHIFSRLQTFMTSPIRVHKIRIHGDYHLGQVLFTGKDFVIIDFEGEPMRPIEARRQKRPAFQDLAGMIRSFHYAVYAALLQDEMRSTQTLHRLMPFGEIWFYEVSRTFLKSYLAVAESAPFVPKTLDERERLLNAFLLSKAMYELLYELNNRPDWVVIPLRGIVQILSES
ncbi:MAG: putative maltokinase [Chloroherpetonaceae bacterium]